MLFDSLATGPMSLFSRRSGSCAASGIANLDAVHSDSTQRVAADALAMYTEDGQQDFVHAHQQLAAILLFGQPEERGNTFLLIHAGRSS